MNTVLSNERQALVNWKSRWIVPMPAFQRYGLAILCVSIALGGALLVDRYGFRDVEVPLFLFAVAIAAWYGGTGAAVLALLLSCLSFDYFFTAPLYTLDV